MTMVSRKAQFVSIFYSMGIHVIILSFLLTLPIDKGDTRLRSFREIFVYPQEERGDAVSVMPSKPGTAKTSKRPLQSRRVDAMKSGGRRDIKEVAPAKTGTPEKESAKASEMREDLEHKPVEAEPEVQEKTEAGIFVAEGSPEEKKQEEKSEGSKIEENTHEKPDTAAKRSEDEKVMEERPSERPIKQQEVKETISAPPKAEVDKAETKGEGTEKALPSTAPSVKSAEDLLPPALVKGPPEVAPVGPELSRQETAPSAPVHQTSPQSGMSLKEGIATAKKATEAFENRISVEKKGETVANETEGKKNKKGVERPGLGIPLSEAFLLSGIRIELLLDSKENPNVVMRLLKKPYPNADRKAREKKKEIEVINEKEEMSPAEAGRIKRSFSVENADKGVYTFVMENKEDKVLEAALSFSFYKGGHRERTKKYDAVKVAADGATKFKFLFPDMIFWDDEDAFTGSIEDSDSLTKFNPERGLLWKEEKNDSNEEYPVKKINR